MKVVIAKGRIKNGKKSMIATGSKIDFERLEEELKKKEGK